MTEEQIVKNTACINCCITLISVEIERAGNPEDRIATGMSAIACIAAAIIDDLAEEVEGTDIVELLAEHNETVLMLMREDNYG